MLSNRKIIAIAFGLSFSLISQANSSINSYAELQLGSYWSTQGLQQHINIESLVGNEYTLTQDSDNSWLVGLGYFFEGQKQTNFELDYGIDAFYLAKTTVSGNIIQEGLFENLSYNYNIINYPIFAVIKSIFKTKYPRYDVILDLGIGPNFMRLENYNENSLDGVTLPDNFYSSHTTTNFAATIGAGFRINNVLGKAPVECGYRFFYLGQGNFTGTNPLVQGTLTSGPVYANTVVCATAV